MSHEELMRLALEEAGQAAREVYKVQEEREKLDPATQKPVLDKIGRASCRERV